MKPTQKPQQPTELEVLKTRLAHLEDKVEALMTLQNPVTFGGRSIARCSCNKLSTRTVSVNHPTQGMHSQPLCDACEPHGFVRVLSDMAPTAVSIDLETDEKVLAFSRRINGYLSFRQ